MDEDTSMLEKVVALSEMFDPMIAFTSGLRAKFRSEGFSADHSEAMAVDAWHMICYSQQYSGDTSDG